MKPGERTAFEEAHDESSADEAFKGPNQVEIHKIIVQREPTDNPTEFRRE
ncbi:MAG: hypothetical protein ABEJ27_05255 [Halodesulfurarchaeum sp.]